MLMPRRELKTALTSGFLGILQCMRLNVDLDSAVAHDKDLNYGLNLCRDRGPRLPGQDHGLGTLAWVQLLFLNPILIKGSQLIPSFC